MRFGRLMRVLIQDYSNPDSTEAMYLCQSFNSIGVESTLWNSDRISAYDAFDSFPPQVFIAHFFKMTNDIIKYLAKTPDIKVILNMTGAQQNHIDQLDGVIQQFNINCPFIFTNTTRDMNKLKSSVVELTDLAPALDVFSLGMKHNLPEFSLDFGVVTNYDCKSRLSSIFDDCNGYHFLSTDSGLTDKLDITAPELQLQALYPKYKKILIARDDQVIPQSIFSAVYHGAKVYYKAKYETQNEITIKSIQNLFKVKGSFDLDKEFDSKKVRTSLLKNHTCYNRAQKLSAKLGLKEIKAKFDEKIGELE
jgi:hypothetical protein